MVRSESWEESVAYCKSILEKFKPKHERIKIFIGFEVKPAIWHDCPLFENPEDAIKQAEREDMIESRFKKRKGDKWMREIFGWDDGDAYIHHEERGNFSIKRHPELHRKLVDIAIQYLEEHGAKSEEELAALTPSKRRRLKERK